jgi:hypothetical protein
MASPERTNVRRRVRRSIAVAVAFAALAAATAGASAQSSSPFAGFLLDRGRYVTVDVPADLKETAPEGLGPIGINDRGEIVGSYTDNRGMVHGFLLQSRGRFTRFTNIDVPGALGTQAEKINNRGQIVGKYGDDEEDVQNNTLRGFLYDRGRFIPIDFPGAQQTLAHGINDRGQVAASTPTPTAPSMASCGTRMGSRPSTGRTAGVQRSTRSTTAVR